jgi:hypothetical protein
VIKLLLATAETAAEMEFISGSRNGAWAGMS